MDKLSKKTSKRKAKRIKVLCCNCINQQQRYSHMDLNKPCRVHPYWTYLYMREGSCLKYKNKEL
jgi:hypothetical protein